ncbi:MAG: iron export ABC transporter permease subunit FetB, partial [Alkalinema sp. CAN_BIN05]|nr:iron export ABC transporter permease subunit FetB [Alkalinema sp. CAN_BIN05]
LWSLGLVVGAVGLSVWQRLDLAMPILIAVGRSILQMIIFCYLLAIVFALHSPWATAIAALTLILISSLLSKNQINNRIPFLFPMLTGILFFSSALTLAYTHLFVTPNWSWFEARSVLPFLGMLLSSMSANTIAATQLIQTLNTHRLEIETHLSLGATPKQAIAQYQGDAVRSAVMPQISALTILGLGILPTFMSGQLIAGLDPLQTGAYQLLILFMSLFATLLTTILLTLTISQQFLTKDAQLLTW